MKIVDRQKIISNRDYYRNRLRILLAKLNLNNKTIIDLGCGEMILYELVKDQIKRYVGIDRILFRNSEHFVHGNILDKEVFKDLSADFVFLLGVLDHLTIDEKIKLLEICEGRYHESLIISQRNPKSFIHFFYSAQSKVYSIEDNFQNHSIIKFYLLKIPFTSLVFNLSEQRHWIQIWCTEIVYVISV